jgi:hypothetical protein
MTVRYKGESYVDAAAHNAKFYTYHRVEKFYQDMIFKVCKPMWDYKRFCYGLDGIEMICIHFHSPKALEECFARLKKLDCIAITRLEEQSFEVYAPRRARATEFYALPSILDLTARQRLRWVTAETTSIC